MIWCWLIHHFEDWEKLSRFHKPLVDFGVELFESRLCVAQLGLGEPFHDLLELSIQVSIGEEMDDPVELLKRLITAIDVFFVDAHRCD